MSDFSDFMFSFFGAGVGTALVGFLGKDWLAVRLKASIDEEFKTKAAAFEIKRQACVDALSVVDAHYAQTDWKKEGVPLRIEKQDAPQIAKARECFNRLALTCKSPEVIRLYLKSLGIGEPMKGSDIHELRNAMREELGFGSSLDLSDEKLWIGALGRPKS